MARSVRQSSPGTVGSDAGPSNIDARQVGQIVCVTPAADGGAVITHWHHAQTTISIPSIIQPLFFAGGSCAAVHAGARRSIATAVPVQATVSSRNRRTLWTPLCSILERPVLKEATLP